MSIIIQAGHHSSHSEKLMQMLYERGLSEPVHSQSRNLSAKEIAQTLAKIAIKKQQSVINTKIIDNLTIDLILANMDQDDWGWADESNLDSLDYWQATDPSARFILVFDSPKLLLKSLVNGELDVAVIESAIDEWVDYHERLLAFFDQHSDLSLLLEGETAVNNLGNIKDKIQTITTNLKLKSNWQLQTTSELPCEQSSALFEMITDKILAQYPRCLQLYDELLDRASIRLATKTPLNQKQTLKFLVDSLNQLKDEEELKQKMRLENAWLKDKILNLNSEKHSLIQKLSDNRLLIEQADKKQMAAINQIKQENEQLFGQLQQVQEELEKYHLKNQQFTQNLHKEKQKQDELAKKLGDLENAKQKAEEAKQKAEQTAKQKADELAKVQQQKDSDLKKLEQAKQQALEHAKRQANQQNEQLVGQLHRVQEELERYYTENQQLKAQSSPARPLYYGAADRVKQDLPYRLGATMVSHSKSAKDLATLPLALAKEYRQFQKDDQELPPLEAYQDAEDAERVKKHLSYRLGKTLVEGVKSKSILDLPMKLGKELVEFKK